MAASRDRGAAGGAEGWQAPRGHTQRTPCLPQGPAVSPAPAVPKGLTEPAAPAWRGWRREAGPGPRGHGSGRLSTGCRVVALGTGGTGPCRAGCSARSLLGSGFSIRRLMTQLHPQSCSMSVLVLTGSLWPPSRRGASQRLGDGRAAGERDGAGRGRETHSPVPSLPSPPGCQLSSAQRFLQ